ncbi:MAG: hypothetical protein LBC64_09485 [Fibromonadaceae bacterium]|jgi:hypothetical protein|nr:hypothetical protein [Fibromonadaceae bacterium]
MKNMYVFLCVVVVLFLGSCADLSMDNEEALKADFPSDFNWKEYKEINNDVAMSQIVLDLNGKRGDKDSIKYCVNNILRDLDFAKTVYVDYLQCPEQSWDKNDRCFGKYGNNINYSKAIVRYNPATDKMDTIGWQCVIGTCWSEGWGELKDSLEAYSEATKIGLPVIKTMCQFIPEVSGVGEARSYLENFLFNSTLIEQHYHFFGRYDGRPYKYCNGNKGEEKNQEKHAEKRGTYYDYGRYTFCLDKNDEKIYVAQ